jgi:hypothetical protein
MTSPAQIAATGLLLGYIFLCISFLTGCSTLPELPALKDK